MARPVAEVARGAAAVLLDFDGSVCDLFRAYPAHDIACHLREDPASADLRLPRAADPLELLRRAADVADRDRVRALAGLLAGFEITASYLAVPTPHVGDVLAAAAGTGRRVAIVSNRSTAVVAHYLRHAGLPPFAHVSARDDDLDPALLKPATHLLDGAVRHLGLTPGDCVLVGNSVTDVYAAARAGARSVGYADRPGAAAALAAARADAVVDTLAALAAALRATPVRAR
ncbi:HAD family hydrolase [Pilimelia terevasa]|uniref:HAD family hydrolase n=1 Tax=Pilimelia terevasa TaxID=53372 RepID=UPI0016669939|nr:HAD family hydrolase [Pilimelia terevasa]